jgi:oligosaccharide reducing-end xylanase
MYSNSGAFYTKEYRNVFKELGYSQKEIDKKVEDTFNEMFYGDEHTRIYHPVGEDMGYIVDTGNIDVRTEGMSYGMMMCVQMNKKEEFDRIWRWVKKYMYHKSGEYAGYFAWSCKLDGTRNANGPAPDGEEYFAMALFFASHRWGDGPEPLNYSI